MLAQRVEIIQTGAQVSLAGAALLLVNDRLYGSEVHWRLADSRNLRGDTRPMKESRAIAGKAGPGGGALGIIIGGQGIPLYK